MLDRQTGGVAPRLNRSVGRHDDEHEAGLGQEAAAGQGAMKVLKL